MSIRKYINNIQDQIENILKAHYIADAVNTLKPEVSTATITAPPHAGLAELINLAQKNGIGTSENQKAKLTLIPVDYNTNTPLAGYIKILLMPIEKKYRKMLKNLSQSQAQQAWAYYEKFNKNLDVFDIILNEGQSTTKTLLALIHKLYLLQKLRQMRQRPVPAGIDGISCFIIWGHGLEHKNEILKMIEKHLQIVTVQDKKIPDITKFMQDIYIEEILKIGYHIVKKNKHLLKHRKGATLILTKNKKNPRDFTCSGHGPNQRECSSIEEHLKQVIRDTYNPRKATGIRSEQHVIHGTQSPLQIENILIAFGLKPLRHWLENRQMSEKPQITDCLNWQDADFRYLKLHLESRRKHTLNAELQTRRENIEILSQALKECDIPFWIHGKTLMGIVRYGQFIIEDHDDDIGVLSKYRTGVCHRLYPKLKENGFQAIRYNDTMLSVIRNDRYIDICFFEQDEDKIGYGNKWFPKKYFEKLDSVRFHGKEYPVPSDAEKLLEIMFPERSDKQNIPSNLRIYVKKAKNKLKQARRWIKSHILQKKIISPLSFEQFLECKIEDDAAINWTLRRPHLDLITNKGKIRKIGDIIEYFKVDSRLEDIKNNHIIETDTSEPFEEPVNLNNRFWQTGNNYLFYCIYYGFRKNIVSYDTANNYIKNVKEPRLYSAEYFEKLPPMNDSEIQEMLKSAPIIINRNAIVHGKHRACAMIGRIIAGKSYIPFYTEKHAPRFALKIQ